MNKTRKRKQKKKRKPKRIVATTSCKIALSIIPSIYTKHTKNTNYSIYTNIVYIYTCYIYSLVYF